MVEVLVLFFGLEILFELDENSEVNSRLELIAAEAARVVHTAMDLATASKNSYPKTIAIGFGSVADYGFNS